MILASTCFVKMAIWFHLVGSYGNSFTWFTTKAKEKKKQQQVKDRTVRESDRSGKSDKKRGNETMNEKRDAYNWGQQTDFRKITRAEDCRVYSIWQARYSSFLFLWLSPRADDDDVVNEIRRRWITNDAAQIESGALWIFRVKPKRLPPAGNFRGSPLPDSCMFACLHIRETRVI